MKVESLPFQAHPWWAEILFLCDNRMFFEVFTWLVDGTPVLTEQVTRDVCPSSDSSKANTSSAAVEIDRLTSQELGWALTKWELETVLLNASVQTYNQYFVLQYHFGWWLVVTVLAGLEGKFCFIYIDDILVCSKSFEEHLQHLQEILEQLKKAGLNLKPKSVHSFRNRWSTWGMSSQVTLPRFKECKIILYQQTWRKWGNFFD